MEDWTAVKDENGFWVFTWTGAPADIFMIWLDGVLIDTVTGTEYDCEVDGYEDNPPPLEIVDDEDDAENDLYPPIAKLQWRGVAGATAYLIERYVGTSWITYKTIYETSAGWYLYTTAALTDQASEQWRISALDERGNAGTTVPFAFSLVCNPVCEDVDYTINASNDLVVSEAA